jgi:hypothetical protein
LDASFVIGDQNLAFDNLLILGLSRRGISGHLTSFCVPETILLVAAN